MKPGISPMALAALHATGFGGARSGRAWDAREFAGFLGEAQVFVCPAPERGAGFALGRAAAGEAELLTLVVAPDFRRRGIGRLLLDAFEREAWTRDADEAFLDVAHDNTAALALYVGAGYAERGRRPGYYTTTEGKRADALLLSRTFREGEFGERVRAPAGAR